MNEELYPEGPKAVPPGFTRPTRGYAVQVWLAMAGVLGFVALYLWLCFWFGRNALRSFINLRGASGDKGFVGFLVGAISLILAVFLIKGLFAVVRGGGKQRDVELTQKDEPALFGFLYRLADEAGAPRPHRVFVSPFVNAAVFYDLSLFNLIFPSKKNLEIGLGLVNALTLTDLKAVLAHEFGHFAQRSMAVGRYVYIAQQIAGQIVARRDWFDNALSAISRTDIRLAWVGWVLRLIVWSLRSLLDTAFSVVILAQRALSREMEFQADLVAVSLTGSDAIVHALHRLEAADEALDRAIEIAASEKAAGRLVPDLFALQLRVTERMRVILDDESHGHPPPLPAAERALHRVFGEKLAQAPRMWSTHPSNREREENAKRRYVEAPLDDRSAWILFAAPDTLREKVTASLLELGPAAKETRQATLEEAYSAVDGRFSPLALQKQYRGVYLKRSPALHSASGADLIGAPPPPEALRGEMQSLYPPELRRQLASWRALEEEVVSLQALRDGILAAPGGVIRHRGRVLKRRDLPKAIQAVSAERDAARNTLAEHDRRCRTVHRAVAVAVGGEWASYLDGLRALYHYATHAGANVDDARGHLGNVLSVVLADGSVSGRERKRLVAAANELYLALLEVDHSKEHVFLPPVVAKELGAERWRDALPDKFGLNPPAVENIGDWLQVMDSWHSAFSDALSALRGETLQALLETEASMAAAFESGTSPGEAPPPARVPPKYTTRCVGTERERQRRLGLWDRFVTADGFLPSLARLAVAGAILGPVVGFSGKAGEATIVVYNGLDTIVRSQIGNQRVEVWPNTSTKLDVQPTERLRIVTSSFAGNLIESFDADASNGLSTYVYDVASAVPLVKWTAVYGSAGAVPEEHLGTTRWQSVSVDHLFSDPPKSVQTKGGGATRSVLSAAEGTPGGLLGVAASDAERDALVTAHATFDDAGSVRVLEWMGYARELPGFPAIVEKRLAMNPRDIPALRAEQDEKDPAKHAAACERQRAMARTEPSNPDLAYLALRCDEDDEARRPRALQLWRENPKHSWIAFVAAHALLDTGKWQDSLRAFETAAALPALKDSIALTVGRMLRFTGAPPSTTSLDLSRARGLEEIERAEPQEGASRPYQLLAQGSIEAAVAAAKGEREFVSRFLRLAGASDGAPQELVQRALAMPPTEGLDEITSWSMIGLALREKAPFEPYVATIGGTVEQATVRELVQKIRTGDARGATAVLEKLSFEERARAAGLGTVALGKAAPDEWRKLARLGLYAIERPYLGR